MPLTVIGVCFLLALSFLFWLDKFRLSLFIDRTAREREKKWERFRRESAQDNREFMLALEKQLAVGRLFATAACRYYNRARLYEGVASSYMGLLLDVVRARDEKAKDEIRLKMRDLDHKLVETERALRQAEAEAGAAMVAELVESLKVLAANAPGK
jgi:hypothetical protein